MRTSSVCAALVAALLAAQAASAAEVVASVERAMQTMVVSADGTIVYLWLISSGRRPSWTPPGVYRPYRLDRRHYSREYHTPMPFSVFFDGGRAVHGTTGGEDARLGEPASHGCVRLSVENAKTFFELTKANGLQHVTVIVR